MVPSLRFVVHLWSIASLASAFSVSNHDHPHGLDTSSFSTSLYSHSSQRRQFLQTSSGFISGLATISLQPSSPSWALDNPTESSNNNGGVETASSEIKSVQTPLYYILRVREATEQETRLIKSGKFKDLQRANVKLAVRFMIDNYRLNDNFIAASAFLSEEKKIKAVDIGQNVVQNLYTILEYFDSSDVENIKVSVIWMNSKFITGV